MILITRNEDIKAPVQLKIMINCVVAYMYEIMHVSGEIFVLFFFFSYCIYITELK